MSKQLTAYDKFLLNSNNEIYIAGTKEVKDRLIELVKLTTNFLEEDSLIKTMMENFIYGRIPLQQITTHFDDNRFVSCLKMILRNYYKYSLKNKSITDAVASTEVVTAITYIDNQIALAQKAKESEQSAYDLINLLY